MEQTIKCDFNDAITLILKDHETGEVIVTVIDPHIYPDVHWKHHLIVNGKRYETNSSTWDFNTNTLICEVSEINDGD